MQPKHNFILLFCNSSNVICASILITLQTHIQTRVRFSAQHALIFVCYMHFIKLPSQAEPWGLS